MWATTQKMHRVPRKIDNTIDGFITLEYFYLYDCHNIEILLVLFLKPCMNEES